MSKKTKKSSASVVWAVVLLFAGIAVIAASFGMQEWQIRQDADEYEALMQSVKAPPQSSMEESSKHLPDENAADAASTDIPKKAPRVFPSARMSRWQRSRPRRSRAPRPFRMLHHGLLHREQAASTLPPAKRKTAISSHGCKFPVQRSATPWCKLITRPIT